jgi:hypothetical protein
LPSVCFIQAELIATQHVFPCGLQTSLTVFNNVTDRILTTESITESSRLPLTSSTTDHMWIYYKQVKWWGFPWKFFRVWPA